MNKILLDGNIVEQFVKDSLPMLIHGKSGSGASLYTISLAANFFTKGLPIIILCGYSMAEEEFTRQTTNLLKNTKAEFYTKEKTEEFKNVIASKASESIVIVKNAELFNEDVFGLVLERQNIIISGDINRSPFKKRILAKSFSTEVYFSPFDKVQMPVLNKYEGFVKSGDYKGITNLRVQV